MVGFPVLGGGLVTRDGGHAIGFATCGSGAIAGGRILSHIAPGRAIAGLRVEVARVYFRAQLSLSGFVIPKPKLPLFSSVSVACFMVSCRGYFFADPLF